MSRTDASRTASRSRAAAYVALTKPRIIELLLVTTLPTMVVAKRGLPSIGLMAATLVGGSLAAGGANAIILEAVAFAELWLLVNPLSAVLAVSATLFYVFVYTLWLKRTSTRNIVIGGAAGAVPVLVGWAAVRDSLGLAPLV